ncbi:MAG: tyrosine-protein phosphatase [Anaerolineae bacterium]
MIWNIIGTVLAITAIALITLRLMVVRGGRGILDEEPLSFLQEPESKAQVVGLPNGDYKVSWKKSGSIKIFVSTNSGKEDLQQLSSLQGEQSFVHLNPILNHRYFYTIQHKDGSQTHAASRIWHLPGILNLRDMGGYETIDGRMTRWGKVYRTAHLGNTSDESLEQLSEIKLSLICDLRSNRELNENPDRVPNGATYLHTPIYKDDQLSGIFPKLLFNRASLGDQLGVGYIRMVDERAEAFAGIIGRLADPENLPAMFHCTAGKDRAGLTAAMLLTLLGVPRKTIIADYTLSNLASYEMYEDFMEKSGSSISRLGVPPEQLKPLFLANPEWLENALNHIDKRFGGVENYLVNEGELSKDKVAELRNNLLD